MNKTFRSIYNESLGAWVAVSEHDSAKGKKSGSAVNASAGARSKTFNLKAICSVFVVLGAFAIPEISAAQTPWTPPSSLICRSGQYLNSFYCDPTISPSVTPPMPDYAIGIGAGSTEHIVAHGASFGSGSIANRAAITATDTYVGKGTAEVDATVASTRAAFSVGSDGAGDPTKAFTRQITNVAAGSADTDAVNVAQLKALTLSSGDMHYYSVISVETGAGSNYANDGASGTNSLAAGVRTKAEGTNGLAIGTGAYAGKKDGTYTQAPSTPGGSTIVDVSSQPNNTIAIGAGAQSSAGNGIAIGTDAKTYQGWNYDKGGKPWANNYGIAIGTEATAINNNIVVGNVGAENLKAAGSETNPRNINNITLGNGAGVGVSGNENIIFGYQAAQGLSSYGGNVAIGASVATNATLASSVAIGSNAGSNAKGSGNVLVGASAGTNIRPSSEVAGVTITCSYWDYYCQGATGDGSNNTMIGPSAGRDSAGAVNVNIGFTAGQNSVGMNNVNIGSAVATKAQGIANVWIGTQSAEGSKGNTNTGVGNYSGSWVQGNSNTALGNGSGGSVKGDSNTGIGRAAGSSVTGHHNTAIGAASGGTVSGDYNFAAAFNAGRFVVGHENVAIGRGAGQGTSSAKLEINRTVAVGQSSKAQSNDAIAIGTGAIAGQSSTGINSIAIGRSTQATGASALAMGDGAQATGSNSIAIGTGTKVFANNAGAFGDPTEIKIGADGAYSVGNDNTVTKENIFVMGNNVTADLAGSVVLGNAADGTVASKYVQTTSATLNGLTYGGFAGSGVLTDGAVVSIGAAGAERQIKHVAAGQISETSTDAINGSQLYATNKVLGNVANSTKNILGGNATLNIDGSMTMSDIGDTGENTVHDAIKKVKTDITNVEIIATKGWNVSANGLASANVAPGGLVDFGNNDGNIVVSRSGTNLKHDLNADLKIDNSITVGDTFIDKSSVTTTNLTVKEETKLGNNFWVTKEGDVHYNGPITGDTHIVNKKYVDSSIGEVSEIANKGWNVSANGAAAEKVAPGATVDFGNNDGNIVVSRVGTDIKHDLSANLKVGESLTIGGDTTNQTIIQHGNISSNSMNVGGGTLTVNQGSVSVKEGTTVNMGGNRITNVAEGVAGTDAVNVNQLKAAISNNTNFTGDLNRIDRDARAGTAAAAAMANLPQAYLPGKSMFAIATGGHRGQQGYAVGLSTISDDGDWVLKGSVSGNSRGHVTYGAGVGYQW
ncbi:MAG: YadA-like family protein [Pelistega sp.]|nr:YadA-like family protein [Pelistega sp.]